MKSRTKVTTIIGKFKGKTGVVVSNKNIKGIKDTQIAVKFGEFTVACEQLIVIKIK